MLDYEKVLSFCIDNGLTFDQFMLLYTLEIRNKEYQPELHRLMEGYYSKLPNVNKLIEELESLDYLTVLKPAVNGRYMIKYLKIKEKFTELLFTDPTDVWAEFIKCYPSQGEAFGYANMVKPGDKEYFIKNILKNADKIAAQKIINTVKEIFDFDESTGKPKLLATVGINRFILNWDTIVEQHNKEKQNNTSWKSRMV